MSLATGFDPVAPPYKMGEKYGVSDIERVFDEIETICAQNRSPHPEESHIRASNIIAAIQHITETVDPYQARPYFDDLAKSISRFENWRGNSQTRIYDSFYGVFAHANLRDEFADWASQVSRYYPAGEANVLATANAAETKLAEAIKDLQTSIDDMRGKPLRSDELKESWKCGEDAFFYIIGNGLSPETPEDTWKRLATLGAYLFTIDNINHNEAVRVGGLARVKKPADYDGPLTDKERERIVLFEARFPALRACEFSSLLDHKCEHLPYGRDMAHYFGDTIHKFFAYSRHPDHDAELAL